MLFSLLLKTPLLGLVLGPIVTILGDRLHGAWAWLDQQGPTTKQLAAVGLSVLFVGLTRFVAGFVTPDACANVAASGISSSCMAALNDPDFLKNVLEQITTASLTAVAIKHGQQNASAASAASDATREPTT